MNRDILLVEDEKNLGITLKDFLDSKGFNISLATTAKEAKKAFERILPSIVILDIGLPDGNGLELAKSFRYARKDFVLLFLTALNDPATRLEGFEIGAEDYISKPFELKELQLRLSNILSRQDETSKAPDEIIFGKLSYYPKRYEVKDAQGKVISLSQKEVGILNWFLKKPGEVISRDELIENVWGQDAFPSNRTIDNFIVKLRKWCETDDSLRITTIRGVGYALEISQER